MESGFCSDNVQKTTIVRRKIYTCKLAFLKNVYFIFGG